MKSFPDSTRELIIFPSMLPQYGLDFFFVCLIFIYLFTYLFIWLHGVLVAAHGLFSCSCRIQFPNQGSNPGPLHQGHGVLTTGPPGESPRLLFLSCSFISYFLIDTRYFYGLLGLFFVFLFFHLFLAMLGLCCCARAFSSCGELGLLFVVVCGLSLWWLLLLWSTGSRRAGFSRRGSQDQLLCGMWDLPRPGLEPMSPALAGGFLTTAPPGKPYGLL